MKTIEATIRQFISEKILFSSNGYPYLDDASFLEEGIIDSMGIMELVAFVDEHFGITVEDTELVPDNFDSITRLAGYVQLKKSTGAF
ncbi:MAG: acyl carrier protein [Anaerolineae bacterium]|nr:acyl carrier protein [Anaerolineae bacterium]